MRPTGEVGLPSSAGATLSQDGGDDDHECGASGQISAAQFFKICAGKQCRCLGYVEEQERGREDVKHDVLAAQVWRATGIAALNHWATCRFGAVEAAALSIDVSSRGVRLSLGKAEQGHHSPDRDAEYHHHDAGDAQDVGDRLLIAVRRDDRWGWWGATDEASDERLAKRHRKAGNGEDGGEDID